MTEVVRTDAFIRHFRDYTPQRPALRKCVQTVVDRLIQDPNDPLVQMKESRAVPGFHIVDLDDNFVMTVKWKGNKVTLWSIGPKNEFS